ncbi:flavin-dependent amine oxidoreductase [Tamilnaduibacter salinus]|uniref:Flavin-dependent amine oxidoreductase n=1 Tax=Tamilnaduibacter salinus TaxID=1484056 RepID=A0A2U1CW36_9GAMM|nr:FAD-dependent oxidoreductase [Tamilnaduibacter salinus]PVY75969.1 flavin-dependent amine oxidoreductase [Tamilnaduibacter salinus]
MNQTDIAIVGGGLAGVGLAEQLHRQGVDYQLFEARDRLGGRIESKAYDGARFDLGPAWFWHVQPRLTAACERFGIDVFEQFSDGELLFEDSGRQVHRGLGFASLVSASLAQLGRLFGSRAEKPVKTVIRDWATEPDTATDADQGFGMEHPSTEITGRIQSIWHGQVLFGASEMAPQFGGYMEGALEQAQRVAQHVLGETANLRSTLLAGSPDSPHQP